MDVVANQLAIKDLLLVVLNESRAHNAEMRQNYDEMRQDFAGIKAQLHIIRHNMDKAENPVSNLERFMPSSIGRTVRFADGLSGDETIHKECIQEHLELIIADLDLVGTPLLDNLIEDSCLSSEEAATLRTVDRRNQNRKLSLMLSHRSKEKFHRFLKHLEQDYPHIQRRLSESYDFKLKAGKRPSECVICAIKKNVDLAHVVDKLCSQNVVNMDFYEVYCSSLNISTDQSNLWEIIFAIIDQARDRRDKIKLLQEALSQKYEHISAKLNLLWAPRMKCQCFRITSTQKTSDGSAGGGTSYVSTLYSQLEDSINSNISNIPSTVKWIMEQVDETCTVTTDSSNQDFSHLGYQQTNDDNQDYTQESCQQTNEVNNIGAIYKTEDVSFEGRNHHDDDERVKSTIQLDNDFEDSNTKRIPSSISTLTDARGDHNQSTSNRRKKRNRRKKNKGRKKIENEEGLSTEQDIIHNDEVMCDLNMNQIRNTVPTQSDDTHKTNFILAELQNVPSLPTSASVDHTVSPTEIHLQLSTAKRKTASGVLKSFPPTECNNPEYVTDQIIITPSNSVDSSCNINKTSDYVSAINNKKTRKKRKK